MSLKNDLLKKQVKNKSSVVAVGTFDGVHQAHAAIMQKLVEQSHVRDYKSVVFTFLEPPSNFFTGKKNNILNLESEKTEIIKSYGVDLVLVNEFNDDLANLSAEDFIKDILIGRLGMKILVSGDDNKFGKSGSGSIEELRRLSEDLDFELIELPSVLYRKYRVSSSNIRQFLRNGDIEIANKMLGYNYFLQGAIVDGNKIGRTIGFPTANVQVCSPKLIPATGVYAVLAELNGKKYPAMCNIGVRPTINLSHTMTIEVHIFNFKKNIYGENIKLHFVNKVRDEISFASIDELVKQLNSDKIMITKLLKSNNKN